MGCGQGKTSRPQASKGFDRQKTLVDAEEKPSDIDSRKEHQTGTLVKENDQDPEHNAQESVAAVVEETVPEQKDETSVPMTAEPIASASPTTAEETAEQKPTGHDTSSQSLLARSGGSDDFGSKMKSDSAVEPASPAVNDATPPTVKDATPPTVKDPTPPASADGPRKEKNICCC